MLSERSSAHDVTADDIRLLLSDGQRELNELEYKSIPPEPRALLKEACAIANFGGGFILVGIDEQDSRAKDLRHIEKVESAVDSIRQTLRDGLTPRPVIEAVPLSVEGCDIIVIRLAPQNGPHMISRDKRTDFLGRYDNTSDFMRYDEIERAFRDKLADPDTSPGTAQATLETVAGRIDVSLGSKGALDKALQDLSALQQSALSIVAISDGNYGSISETDADRILTNPIYSRQGGWLAARSSLPISRSIEGWVQRLGDSSVISLGGSGDLLFTKAIDPSLCHRQEQIAFELAPRIYPNAIVEYCLSFMYTLADVAAVTKPEKILVAAVMTNASHAGLPRGEGGSIWVDAPSEPLPTVGADVARSNVLAVKLQHSTPMRVRHEAHRLLGQIYGFFGYLERYVPFSTAGEVSFQADSDPGKLAALRAYLQTRLNSRLEGPSQDFERGTVRFAFYHNSRRRIVAISEEFLDDWSGSETSLFANLGSVNFAKLLASPAEDGQLLITPEGAEWVG